MPLPAGELIDKQIRVRFTYDINGLLEVETTVATGAQKKLVIEGSPGSMTPEEIEERLKALEELKIHPRETMENRAVLARGERLYEESLGAVRQHISREMARFEAALEGQDPREVAKAREELVRELDRIEGKAWRLTPGGGGLGLPEKSRGPTLVPEEENRVCLCVPI